MQFTLADAVVRFIGDDSQLKKDTEAAKGGLTRFAGTATKVLGGAVVAGAALAGAAVLKIGAAAFDVSRQTETAAADIAANLGIPTAEAEKFAEVARRVYGENFAGSVMEAGEAVAELNRQLGITDEVELQSLTEGAFALSDVFGVDVNESISAAKTLMDNFGLGGQEAFDMIAAGFQGGLNSSGDFLDTIGEYSTQFASGGASAAGMFGLIEQGLQGGMLGTDKAADLFKEFRLRIMEGGDDVAEALEEMGYDADQVFEDLGSGAITANNLFGAITTSLGNTEDPMQQMRAGMALMGGQFEDLGDKALFLDTMPDHWEDIGGSVDSLNAKYENFGDVAGAMWRKLVVAVAPLTDKLLDLANRAMPTVERVFESITNFITNRLVPALDGTTGSFDGIKQWIDTYMPGIRDTVQNILQQLAIFWENHGATIMHVVQNTFHVISTTIGTVLQVITGVIQAFLQIMNGDFQGAGQTLYGVVQNLMSGLYQIFATQLDSIRSVINGFGGGMYDAGRALIENLWNGIRDRFDRMLESMRDRLRRLRDLMPGSEPKDTSSPLYGLRESGRGLIEQMQRGINDVQLNIGQAIGPSVGMGAALSAAGNQVSVTVNVNGGGPETGQQARRGVLDALRQAGVR